MTILVPEPVALHLTALLSLHPANFTLTQPIKEFESRASKSQ